MGKKTRQRLYDNEANFLGLTSKKHDKNRATARYMLTKQEKEVIKKEFRHVNLQPKTAKLLGLDVHPYKTYSLNKEQFKKYSELDQAQIKRLFFDIETTPYEGWFWNAYPKFIPHDMVKKEQRIICISYKWEGEDKVYRMNWKNKYKESTIKEIKKLLDKAKDKETIALCNRIISDYLFDGCDKELVGNFVKVMNDADECIAHNGDRYDVKVLRTRAVLHRLPMMPKYRTHDTLKKARSGFKFFSNRLDALAKDLGVGAKVKHDGWSMWERCMKGEIEALTEMGTYCDGDIIVLEDVYFAFKNYVTNNTHVGVNNGKMKACCPSCASEDISLIKNNFTAKGTIKRLMECNTCGYDYEISNRDWRNFLEMKQNHGIIQ